jgi:putative ubiquitin-RnfH superfamily antitoxin RatB of RatAB toxin-antitoxin module
MLDSTRVEDKEREKKEKQITQKDRICTFRPIIIDDVM